MSKVQVGTEKNVAVHFSLKRMMDFVPVIALLLLIVGSGFLSDKFLTASNIFNLLRQYSGLIIISIGMLMTILTGGIDLSVGSLVALTSVLVAFFSLRMPIGFAILLTVCSSSVVGACSGYLIAHRRLAPFVVTLAAMTIARGLAYMISKGTPIRITNTFLLNFGKKGLLYIPFPVVLALVFFLIALFVLRYTSFGRLIKAVGSNESAVRLSGIRVTTYKWSVYIISGALCAFGGIISAARTGVGSPIVGEGLELDAIASVVIGGASLSGGNGTVLNTLMGVLILGLIGNIMNLMNVASYPQQVIKGVIILLAVLLQSAENKK